MFKEARIKLTGWYLLIIMAISLSFSGAIYANVDKELVRMDNAQKDRQTRIENIRTYLQQNRLPLPPENFEQDQETIEQARVRIITALGLINASILIISGVGGYLLAGLTLNPIQKMVNEQKDFVGNASHELRTPLTSLKTEIEVALRDKKMNLKDARKLLESNLDDINGMQRLSNYLLELSKIDNSEGKLKIEEFDLGKVISNTVDNFVPRASAKGITITKNISKVNVKGDLSAVQELASILIDNAIKYSGNGKKVQVVVKDSGVFGVKDFGIGISETDLPHIFDRFYRADVSRSKEKVKGYGLGLAIAKSLADKMGVKITVKSVQTKGSTFSIQFPLA